MSNGAKITIIIAIALAIGVTIYGVTSNKKDEKNEVNNMTSDVMDMFNEYEESSNNIENNEVNEVDNSVENNSNTVKTENTNVTTTNTDKVVGKEEQASANENTDANDEQKAIELAKKEWGISVDSYDYNAELQNDGTYLVRVIGKNDRNEVTRYTVNVKSGTATEVQ